MGLPEEKKRAKKAREDEEVADEEHELDDPRQEGEIEVAKHDGKTKLYSELKNAPRDVRVEFWGDKEIIEKRRCQKAPRHRISSNHPQDRLPAK